MPAMFATSSRSRVVLMVPAGTRHSLSNQPINLIYSNASRMRHFGGLIAEGHLYLTSNFPDPTSVGGDWCQGVSLPDCMMRVKLWFTSRNSRAWPSPSGAPNYGHDPTDIISIIFPVPIGIGMKKHLVGIAIARGMCLDSRGGTTSSSKNNVNMFLSQCGERHHEKHY